jgi:hypothetical protein
MLKLLGVGFDFFIKPTNIRVEGLHAVVQMSGRAGAHAHIVGGAASGGTAAKEQLLVICLLPATGAAIEWRAKACPKTTTNIFLSDAVIRAGKQLAAQQAKLVRELKAAIRTGEKSKLEAAIAATKRFRKVSSWEYTTRVEHLASTYKMSDSLPTPRPMVPPTIITPPPAAAKPTQHHAPQSGASKQRKVGHGALSPTTEVLVLQSPTPATRTPTHAPTMHCNVGLAGAWHCGTGMAFELSTCLCGFCRAGQYSSSKQRTCRKCPSGRYSSKGMGACSGCPSGYTGLIGGCNPCPLGRWSVHSSPCKACVEGAYTKVIASTECNYCAEGTTPYPLAEAAAIAAAAATAAGDNALARKYTGCVGCAAGKYGILGGLCAACPRGLYTIRSGQTQCLGCPHGKFPRPPVAAPTTAPNAPPIKPADGTYTAAKTRTRPTETRALAKDDDDDWTKRRLLFIASKRRLLFTDDDVLDGAEAQQPPAPVVASPDPTPVPAPDPCESCAAGKYLKLQQVRDLTRSKCR